jgi:hypothetical protein
VRTVVTGVRVAALLVHSAVEGEHLRRAEEGAAVLLARDELVGGAPGIVGAAARLARAALKVHRRVRPVRQREKQRRRRTRKTSGAEGTGFDIDTHMPRYIWPQPGHGNVRSRCECSCCVRAFWSRKDLPHVPHRKNDSTWPETHDSQRLNSPLRFWLDEKGPHPPHW